MDNSSNTTVLCIIFGGAMVMLMTSSSRQQPTFFIQRCSIYAVRLLRPYLTILGCTVWALHRTRSRSSLLTVLNDAILWLRDKCGNALAVADTATGRIDSLFGTSFQFLLDIVLIVVADVLAIGGCLALIRAVYCLVNYSWKEWETLFVDAVFEWSRRNIPMVRQWLEQQLAQVAAQSDNFLKKDPKRTILLELPAIGRSAEDVIRELHDCAAKENKCWKDGQLSGTVYVRNDDTTHTDLMDTVYSLYMWSNPLHPGCWPKINQCEAEVVAMVARLLHAPTAAAGTMTSGGTESIILAVRASLIYYGHGIRHPEIVCGSTAHAGLNKACEMFGIRQVVIDCNDGHSYQLNPQKVARAITSNTVMIYASAPCYPQGVVDPIVELAHLAHDFNIGLHVDACLGGFVLAFLSDDDNSDGDDVVPVFDFRAGPGVTSMSIDTHKYGYASKGTSVVLYRNKQLRAAQFFTYAHWTGGIYSTPTIAGSRPGALSACAWAALVSIGHNGYRARADAIVAAAREIATAVQQDIPELYLLTQPRPYMVVCLGSRVIDIYRIRDVMNTNFGWCLNALQFPSSIHFCVTMNLVGHVKQFIANLKESVQLVVASKEGQHDVKNQKSGTAGMYGSVGSMPSGPISCILGAFTDAALSP